MHTLDLRIDEPRSPHEEIGGVKLLARIVDKGRAAINGTLGSYRFFDCPLDRVFFEAVNVSRHEFLDVLQQAYTSEIDDDDAALADLRESLECKPEISDEQFMQFAEARNADHAIVRWLFDRRRTSPSVVAAINAAVESLSAEAFIDWKDTSIGF